MTNLFEMYYNNFLKNVFEGRKSNYIQTLNNLENFLKSHLTGENLVKFNDYKYNLIKHYEDIALEEIENAFYRGFRYGCDLNLFISEDND